MDLLGTGTGTGTVSVRLGYAIAIGFAVWVAVNLYATPDKVVCGRNQQMGKRQPQLTMLAIILWCPWLLRAGPRVRLHTDTHTHSQRKQSTCEASEPNDQVHFGLYCSANLGAKSLDKGWTDRPGPTRPVSFGPFDRESFLPQNRSNACAEPISEGILYPLPTHVNQIRNWHRVRSQLKMLISVN